MDKYAQLASLFGISASTGTSELDKLFGLRPITDEERAGWKRDREARISELLQQLQGDEQRVEPSGTSKIPELSGNLKKRAEQLAPIYQEVSAKYGVPFDLLMAQAHQESGFNPAAVSSKGAVGTAQFMPGTAKQYGLTNPSDPVASAHAQAKYMRDLLNQFGGDEDLAVAAYNAGPGNVRKAKGIPQNTETPGYVNRVRQLRGLYSGQQPVQSPAGSPADRLLPPDQPEVDPSQFDLVTLTNGSEAYIKKGLSPEEIVSKLQAQGIDALPTRTMKTPSGEDVLVRFNMSDDEALAKLKEQQPALLQRPRGLPAEDKSGLLDLAKKGLLEGTAPILTGLGGEAKRFGEYLGPESTVGQYIAEAGQTAREKGKELSERAEKAFVMPEDAGAFAKNIGYPFVETAAQAVPYMAAFAVPGGGLVRAASGAASLYGGSMGELEEKAKEVGKEFVPGEARPWAAGDVALNMVLGRVLGPLKKVFGPEAEQAPREFVQKLIEKEGIEGAKAKMGSVVGDVLKGAGITGGANVANEIAEDMLYRGYGDQNIFSEDALQSYLATAKQVAPFGVGMGMVHGAAKAHVKAEELTRAEEQAQQDALTAEQLQRDQEMNLGEAMKSARVSYDKLGIESPDTVPFNVRKQAFDDYVAAQEQEKEAVRTALPEDLQQLPTGEAQMIEKLRGEQEKYYAPLALPERGKNISYIRGILDQYDINDPANVGVIAKALDQVEKANIPHNPEGMQALRQKLSEVQNASQIQSTKQIDAGGGERPEGGEEIGYPTEGGEGVRVSDQEGQRLAGEIREVKGAPKEIDKAYHAGDLGYGSDTGLGRMAGSRGTGHFGTGVYFVGDKTKIGSREGRPMHEVDFSDYNLARPDTETDAQGLHEGLRLINRLVDQVKNGTLQTQHEQFPEFRSDEGRALDEAASKIRYALMPKKDGKFVSQEAIVDSIKKHVEERAPVREAVANRSVYEDTAATRVMKDLGYEGVDVRHLPKFDNADYGSVIYKESLAPEAPEIREAFKYPDLGKLKLDINQFQDAKDSKALLDRYMEHGSDEGLKTLANMFASSRHAPAVKVEFVTPETAPKNIAQRMKKGAGAVTSVDRQGATLYFRADKPEHFSEDFILHENLHGMTVSALQRSPHMRNEFNRLTSTIGNALRDASSKAPDDAEAKNLSDFWDHVTKNNPDELLTYGLTSPTFRELFKQYAADGRPLSATRTEAQKGKIRLRSDQPPSEGPTRPVEMTLLQRFTDFLRKLLGIPEKNKQAFEDALAHYEQRQAEYEQHIKDYETIKPLHAHMHERLKTLLDITESEGVALPRGRKVISDGPRQKPSKLEDVEPPSKEEQKKILDEVKQSGLTGIAEKGKLGPALGALSQKSILQPFQTAVFDEKLPIAAQLQPLGANVGNKLRADLQWATHSQIGNVIQQAFNSGYTMLGADGTLEAKTDSRLAPQKIFDRIREQGKKLGMSEKEAWKVVSEMLVRLRGGTIREQDAAVRDTANSYLTHADELEEYARTRQTSDEKRKFKQAATKLRRIARDQLEKLGEGRTYITEEQVEAGRSLYAAYKDTLSKEVDNIHELLRKIPDKLEASGMIDAKTAEQYRKYPFYFPFYDKAEFDDAMADPLKEERLQGYLSGMGRSLKSVADVKKQEHHAHTIYAADNLVRHLLYWDSAVSEHSARKTTCKQLEMTGGATRLPGEPQDKNFVVKVRDEGKDIFYKVHNPDVYYAFQAAAPITGPIINVLRRMARAQRGLAVFNPLFWYKQLIRDPKQASRVAKVGMITPLDALKELTKITTGTSKGYKRILEKGVVGPVDVGYSPQERVQALIQGKGMASKVWNGLNQVHEAVDASVRAVVYDRAYQKYLKRGLEHDIADALAIKDARELMNFSRQGRSELLRKARAVTPFLGSYINGMDVLLKAMAPETFGKLSKADAMEVRRNFIGLSMSFMTLGLGYTLLMSDDEEWVNNKDRNGNVLVRNPFSNKDKQPFLAFPLEFEIGWLQHTLPENLVLAQMGAITPTAEKANIKEAAANVLMPPLDAFSYMRPMIIKVLSWEDEHFGGKGEQKYKGLAEFQDEKASELSKLIVEQLGKAGVQSISPNDMEKVLGDTFAGLWAIGQSASSVLLANREGQPVAPAKTMTEKLPWFGRLFSGEFKDVAVRDAFNVLGEIQEVQNTVSRIKSTKDITKLNKLEANEEYQTARAADKALNGIAEKFTGVSTKIATIMADTQMGAEEKRKVIDELKGEREVIAREILTRAKALGVYE